MRLPFSSVCAVLFDVPPELLPFDDAPPFLEGALFFCVPPACDFVWFCEPLFFEPFCEPLLCEPLLFVRPLLELFVFELLPCAPLFFVPRSVGAE